MEKNEESTANLIELIRHCSMERLVQLSKREDVKMEEMSAEPIVFAHWMSFVLLSGKSLRILFKVHYMSKTAKYFASHIFGGDEDKISSGRALDFFREYCNLTAGSMKIALDLDEIKVGISLPILAKGFDEIFYTRTPDTVTKFWSLISGDKKIFCSTHVTLLEKISVKKAALKTDAPVGDVEFL
jgi:CheY-specific phosphatase CheX